MLRARQLPDQRAGRSDAPASHLQRAVLRGGGFWAAGLRSLYLATALLV